MSRKLEAIVQAWAPEQAREEAVAQNIGRRKRLSTDRCLRVWSIVEHLAQHPGLGRLDLATEFALSERQLQADLNLIREQIGLPIVRAHGYRFAGAPNEAHALSLTDLVALGPIMQGALGDASGPRETVLAMAAKLPPLFSPPLQALARAALVPSQEHEHSPNPETFLCLAESLLRAQPVRLQYLAGTAPNLLVDPVVVPQVVMPYEGSWYVVGACHQLRRVAMFCLDAVEQITPHIATA